MKLTLKEAYKLSVLKWKLIIANHGISLGENAYPAPLDQLKCHCAYCELYAQNESKPCTGCPLDINKVKSKAFWYLNGCTSEGHPFDLWLTHETVSNAKKVLKLIRETKP